ncbi:MAG: ABC-type transport system, multidrug-familypermease [Clostridia bacterium]|jgi:fluoroquinolone transport system permease protein|nr:ABC-type transport system, multidrug-familypermease [Clostridia bacterium]
MRFRGLLLGDIRFQFKYGFYFLYVLLTFVFIAVINAVPAAFKAKTAAVIIFTDPATLGIFFMGAIILLEKSQRVLNSLAVSPIKIWEYIAAKVVSLSIISTTVGFVLGVAAGAGGIASVALGTFLGSVLFTLLGIIIAAQTNSLNRFIITTVPAMLFLMVPPFFELFGYDSNIFNLYPSNIVLRIIAGNAENWLLEIPAVAMWIIFFYVIAHGRVSKMLRSIGGIKL